MRNLLLTCVLLVVGMRAAAQVSLESGCSAAPSSGTSITCTTGALSAGDAILAEVTYFGGAVTAYTDTVGGVTTSLTPISGSLATSTQNYYSGPSTGSDTVLYLQAASAGTHTITITFSATVTYPALIVNAWTGVDAAQSVESYSLAGGSANASVISATAIPVVTSNALVTAFAQVSNGGATITAGSGYALSPYTPVVNVQSEYATAEALGSVAPAFNVSASGSGWVVDAVVLKAVPESGSLAASPTSILEGSTGNAISLTCMGCVWTPGNPGSPTFTITGGGSITSQQVVTATTATATVNAGTAKGVLAINDPGTGNAALVSLPPSSFAVAPSFLVNGTTGNTVTLTGTNTAWTSGTIFTVAGTAATITSQSVSSPTSATLTMNAGVTDGTATITDPSTGNTLPLSVRTPQTWYVRTDGGSRYSTNVTTGQCDGLADVAYPGSGVDQHCAFNDVRMLWQDGSYTDGSIFPAWGWVGEGGDTYIIRGAIADGVSWRVGWQDGVTYCGSTGCWGIAGDASAGAPPPPSGVPSAHTQILGGNYASCSAQSARTQLHGGWGLGYALNFSGSSYVDASCLDVTDFSACGSAGQTLTCTTAMDYMQEGLQFDQNTTNANFTNLRVHGVSKYGLYGPTGDQVTFNTLDILGNAYGGWSTDNLTGITGVGALNVTNFNISWNGCAEEYPIVDPLPYADCTDDSSGGAGDGFGTATVASVAPGWQVHFDQGTVSYNTQDGLDALHISGPGSTMTDTRVLAYGNQGQQLKVGGAVATIQNSVIVGNCKAMSTQAIPGTPTGFGSRLLDPCRANNTAILINVTPNDPSKYQYNTLFGNGNVGLEVEYATADTGSTNTLQYNDNVFVGFDNGSGENTSAIYSNTDLNMLTNPGASWTNNATFGQKASETCPGTGETSAVCTDPGLVDMTYHLYGYGDMQPASASSAVIGAGVPIAGLPLDFLGNTRSLTTPTIGAYEDAASAPTLVSVALLPIAFAQTVGGTTTTLVCTATLSDSSTTPCATQGSVVWVSDAPSVATVAAGVVTPVGVGTANVTATLASITSPPSVDTVSLPPPAMSTCTLVGSATFNGTVSLCR